MLKPYLIVRGSDFDGEMFQSWLFLRLSLHLHLVLLLERWRSTDESNGGAKGGRSLCGESLNGNRSLFGGRECGGKCPRRLR